MHVRELIRSEPAAAVRRLAHLPQPTFLDSAARDASLGRYSYLACDPFSTYYYCVTNDLGYGGVSSLPAEIGDALMTYRFLSTLDTPGIRAARAANGVGELWETTDVDRPAGWRR